MRAAVCITIVLISACAADQPDWLLVELRTDFVPVVEFASVDTVLSRVDEVGARTSPAMFVLTPSADQSFVDGVRVGEFRAHEGPLSLGVRLLTPDGRIVAERTTQLPASRPNALTVVITRSCQGVACPSAADGTPMACVGGRCVDATCSPETPETCGATECETETDCEVGLSLECASARCINSYCFVSADSSLCPDGDRCDIARGCVPEDALECRTDADCVRDGAVGRCDGGSRCVIVSCEAGLGDCDGLVDNGCEADFTDPIFCGSCDNQCGPWPNAAVACSEGVCSIASCLPGFEDCDSSVISGCETNLGLTCGLCAGCGGLTCCAGLCVNLSSAGNCGACGRACSAGQFCSAGACMNI